MNSSSRLLLCVLPLAAALAAQDKTGEAPLSPKTPQHERLAAFTGTWRTDAKMAAMPGVPGMEKPTEMTGSETAELVCQGLWLRVMGEGVCAGQHCSGLWLLGYDPFAKTYQCVTASDMDDSTCCIDGRYDEKTKVWHFEGDSPMGRFRSEFVFETPDRSVETCYSKGENGKETEFMRTVRTRVKGAKAGDAASKPSAVAKPAGADVPAPLAALLADVGTWDADWKMEMPGAPAMSSKCREVVTAICSGKWTWTDFRGEVMGAPFEGHALTGFDAKSNKIVSFWMDSMNGACMRTDGTHDAKKGAFTMRGTCYDEQGKRGPVISSVTSTSKTERQMRMAFGEGEKNGVMTITYRRASK